MSNSKIQSEHFFENQLKRVIKRFFFFLHAKQNYHIYVSFKIVPLTNACWFGHRLFDPKLQNFDPLQSPEKFIFSILKKKGRKIIKMYPFPQKKKRKYFQKNWSILSFFRQYHLPLPCIEWYLSIQTNMKYLIILNLVVFDTTMYYTYKMEPLYYSWE